MLPDTRVNIPAHVLSQKLEDETVLLNVQTGAYFGLNPVASRAWDLLEKGEPIQRVPSMLAAEFDAPMDTIESDLETLLSTLREKQLIQA